MAVYQTVDYDMARKHAISFIDSLLREARDEKELEGYIDVLRSSGIMSQEDYSPLEKNVRASARLVAKVTAELKASSMIRKDFKALRF